MMSRQVPLQSGLFNTPQDLGARVPQDHLLRQVAAILDLEYVYEAVQDFYGSVGKQSVPPPTLMRLMLLLVLYDVSSERQLMQALPMRIDWLWFLGYELDSDLPGHSVLSKARRRWGSEVFARLFQQTVSCCIDAGLIDGREVLVDSSLIDANASVGSLFRVPKRASEITAQAMSRLEESDEPEKESNSQAPPLPPEPDSKPDKPKGAKYRSTTDPDATGAARRGDKAMRPRYQTHRAVDVAHGAITATIVGPGHESEADRLEQLLCQHTERVGLRVDKVTADSKYGTADNLEWCEWNGVTAYINPLRNTHIRPEQGRFTECCFRYEVTSDTYICPAGQRLVKTRYRTARNSWRYAAPAKACRACPMRDLCTKSKRGRTLDRPDRMDILDRATVLIRSQEGQAHRKLRTWMMEGSFAQSVPLGYKRARWRGLLSMAIQDYLISAVQNLLLMVRRGGQNFRKRRQTLHHSKQNLFGALQRRLHDFFSQLPLTRFSSSSFQLPTL